MNFTGILTGAIGGFLSAVLVDVNAWGHSGNPGDRPKFDWGLAAKRWVAGSVAGAVAGIGIGIGIQI